MAGCFKCGDETSGSVRCEKFLCYCLPVRFSGGILLYGVSLVHNLRQMNPLCNFTQFPRFAKFEIPLPCFKICCNNSAFPSHFFNVSPTLLCLLGKKYKFWSCSFHFFSRINILYCNLSFGIFSKTNKTTWDRLSHSIKLQNILKCSSAFKFQVCYGKIKRNKYIYSILLTKFTLKCILNLANREEFTCHVHLIYVVLFHFRFPVLIVVRVQNLVL